MKSSLIKELETGQYAVTSEIVDIEKVPKIIGIAGLYRLVIA